MSRLPALRLCVATLTLFAAMIGGLEAYWRHRGLDTSVPDSPDLWAYHWSQVVGNDPNLIVAIGTSRIRTDLRGDVTRDCFPSHRFVQLGINGASSSLGLLAELSRVPDFCGLVLCDVLPPLMGPEKDNDQLQYLHAEIGRARSLGAYLHGLLCDRLVVLNSAFSLRRCLLGQAFPRSETPGPRFRVHVDRSLDLGYVLTGARRQLNDAKIRNGKIYGQARRYKDVEEFKQSVRRVAGSVERIQKNGGKVVFLRLPASGVRLELEESAYPANEYFPALASVTFAQWIDFRDLVDNGDFNCPDDSHLSLRGARLFTSRLVQGLRLRALLVPDSDPRAKDALQLVRNAGI
jgi:hypothetical protein